MVIQKSIMTERVAIFHYLLSTRFPKGSLSTGKTNRLQPEKIATDYCFYKSKRDRPQESLLSWLLRLFKINTFLKFNSCCFKESQTELICGFEVWFGIFA